MGGEKVSGRGREEGVGVGSMMERSFLSCEEAG